MFGVDTFEVWGGLEAGIVNNDPHSLAQQLSLLYEVGVLIST